MRHTTISGMAVAGLLALALLGCVSAAPAARAASAYEIDVEVASTMRRFSTRLWGESMPIFAPIWL